MRAKNRKYKKRAGRGAVKRALCAHGSELRVQSGEQDRYQLTLSTQPSALGSSELRSDVEQLAGLEEARELELGVLVAVRGMNDVLHHLGAEIAADRALGGLAGVRGPEQVAHLLHDVVAFQRHHDDRARA